MITYQDLLEAGNEEKIKAEFILEAIRDYQNGADYINATIADDYYKCRNTTTMQYQKMLTDVSGRRHVDDLATVHRSTSNFFRIIVTQLTQYLLGNGVKWATGAGEALGKDFDTKLQRADNVSLRGGAAYGFFNLDHVDIFTAREFVPLLDEEDGQIKAGIRFWRIDQTKPLRAILFELDGYTSYMWTKKARIVDSGSWQILADNLFFMPKRPYKTKVIKTEADDVEISYGENYDSFPIVPLWANEFHQSELIGLREKIDAYDFILNGWEDDLDNAQLYWIIKGAGGMDDPDLANFLRRLSTVKAAAPEDGQDVTPVPVNIPFEARSKLLDALEKQIYKDAMVLNPETISGGAATATQIKAAYEPQNNKADDFEYYVIDFIQRLLKLAGVQDEASFDRSRIVNANEEIQSVVIAASYVSHEYVTRKVLTLLGDSDQVEEVFKEIDAEAMDMIGNADEEEEGGETVEES